MVRKDELIKRLESVAALKEGSQITVMNAHARIQNNFLKIDVDKWARVVAEANVIVNFIKFRLWKR